MAASAPMCAVCASTPNDAPSAAAAGKSGAATRMPLVTAAPRSKGARLCAVAAHLHVAPLARVIPRVVDECPAACVRATHLEPLPGAVGHRSRHCGEDAAEAASGRRELDGSARKADG